MKKRGMGLLCALVLTATLLLAACALGEETWTISALIGNEFLKTGTITNGTAILGVNCHTEARKLYIYEVNEQSGDLGDLVIPAEIGGYTIAGFENNAFVFGSKADTLTSITLPATIEEIGMKAFEGCANLSSIDLSPCTKLTQLGTDAFYKCTNLASVTLPENLTSIGNNAFHRCNNLKTICLLSKEPPQLGQSVFQSCSKIEEIIIVNGDVNEYQQASGWSDYEGKIVPGFLLAASPASKEWTLSYGSSEPQTFTLQNDGALTMTGMAVSLVGEDANQYFTLDKSMTASSLAPKAQTNTTFTVAPKPGLVAGTHQAEIRIQADNDVVLSVPLILHVSAAPVMCTVTFDANGGSGDMPSVEVPSGSYTLPICDFVAPEGFRFKAWSVSGTEYAAGGTITLTGNTALVAVWERIHGGAPVFTLPDGPQEVTVRPGERATLTAAATNAVTYQWYVNRGDGKGYVPLSGATGPAYTTAAVALNNDGYTYRCEATNASGTGQSPLFTLLVRETVAPPRTGDDSHTGLWLMLMLVSLGGLAALIACRRRGKDAR